MLAALGGCVSTDRGGGDPSMGGCMGCYGGGGMARSVPGVQGPWGQPVNMAAPYSSAHLGGEAAARAMLAQSVPLGMVQPYGPMGPGSPSGIMQAGGMAPADGSSGVVRAGGNVSPGGTLPNPIMPTGAISPVGVPFTPGGVPPTAGPCCQGPAGAVAAIGALPCPPPGPPPGTFPTRRTEVRFVGPPGMKIAWYAPAPGCPPGCGPAFSSSNQLEAPGRYNFVQGAVYRLKLSDIPQRPGLELYPTLEVVPSNPKTDPFLAHSAVPVSFTETDLDQVGAGNFVVKVIYLPDPHLQELADAGLGEVVSTQLEPGVDPIAEAHRRGCILLIIRLGNIDLEAPNTPPMDAPSAYQAPRPCAMGPGGMMPPNMAMGGMPPGMMPPGMMPPGMARASQMPPMGPLGPGGPMVGASGPLAGPPPGMFGPNAPMVMGPNGPVPAGPGAMMTGYPGAMQPMQPPARPTQAMPASNTQPQQPAAPTGPVTQLPDKLPVQQAGYQGSTAVAAAPPAGSASAQAASQDVTPSQPAAEKPKKDRRWIWFGLNSDK